MLSDRMRLLLRTTYKGTSWVQSTRRRMNQWMMGWYQNNWPSSLATVPHLGRKTASFSCILHVSFLAIGVHRRMSVVRSPYPVRWRMDQLAQDDLAPWVPPTRVESVSMSDLPHRRERYGSFCQRSLATSGTGTQPDPVPSPYVPPPSTARYANKARHSARTRSHTKVP